MNFRKLVNTYRIGYAKRLLRERKDEEAMRLEEIIQLSGYSARSVFYDAFYRVVGMTPQQYMKEEENE
jgi:AraC-like DNA-binding protein